MSSFFGIEVAPGEPAYFRPDDDCPCVRLKRAALIVRGDTVEDGTRILVKCRVAKGALCRDCARASCCFSHHPRPRSIHTHALTPSFPPHTGPPHALASLIPGRMENVKLDLTFLDDTRISVEVAQSAAAAAAAERAAKKSKTTPVTYAVHLTGNVEHDYEVTDAPNGASSSDDELDASGSYGPESSSEDESSSSDDDDTAVNDDAGSDSESWGSGSDLEDEDDTESPARVARESSLAGHGAKGIDGSAEEVDAEARRNAATNGAATGQWATPDPKDEAALGRWDASASTSEWAYHIQNSGARQHRRSSTMPEFKWTGPLRPQKVSPKRSVPKVGWLCPLPDYARTGWPETEFASSLQHKLEVKTPEQMAKMRAACSLGRAVMDAVAAAIAPGVTTDFLDRICHAMTLMNGAYPSPRNYMGFPKSLCTSVNEVVCHGIPDGRPLEDGDIVNLDITVCLNGYHGDLNETYFVGTGTSDPARAEKAKALMKCALECLELAMGRCKPGARFRDLGEAIQTHANGAGYGVVKDFCGHGIGALFHCAPNVPHYAKNKAVGTMKPGMTFTIEPMVNEGTHKTKHWPDGWTAVTADGGRSAQYEHTMVVTETGLDVLTKRTANSRPFY